MARNKLIQIQQEDAKQIYELPESVNKMINSLLKQSNDQNEAQKTA